MDEHVHRAAFTIHESRLSEQLQPLFRIVARAFRVHKDDKNMGEDEMDTRKITANEI